LPTPSDPRRYGEGGIDLKQTRRRLTGLSVTARSCFAGPIFFYRDHSFASGHQVQWAPGDGECVGRVAMLADTRLAAGMG